MTGELLPKEIWAPLARDLDIAPERLDIRQIRGAELARAEATWLETPLTDEWMSAARIIVQGGQLVVAELRIFPVESSERRPAGLWSAELLGDTAPVPPGGLTVATSRKVRLTDYRRFTRKLLGDLYEKYTRPEARKAIVQVFGPPAAVHPGARPRRERPGARPDTFYAKLAIEYERATVRGSRQPIAELAHRHKVERPRMRDMIREARERALLTFFKQGRPGGRATERARELAQPQPKAASRRKSR